MKIHKNFVILFVCLISLVPLIIVSDYRVKKNIEVEEVTLETHYLHPVRGTHRDSEFQIQLLTSSDQGHVENSSMLSPACIVLHGDTIGAESTIMVQRELLDNGFLVVMMEIDSYELYQTMYDLDNTLTYLLTRTDINTSQICMYGHSRGGLYSLLFGAIRKDVIQGVISANYAEWGSYYHRVGVLAATIVPNFLTNYSPSRVLFVIDEKDDRQEDETQEFFTKWDRSTEFQVFRSSTLYGHASGVYLAESLYTEISWLNTILGRELSSPAEETTSFHGLLTVQRNITTTLTLLGIELAILVLILRNIIWLFSNQKMYFTEFRRVWKKKMNKNAEVYPINEPNKENSDKITVKTVSSVAPEGEQNSISSSLTPSPVDISNSSHTSSHPIPVKSNVQVKSWRHARFWIKHDSNIINPAVKSDQQLHQNYLKLISNLSSREFATRMLITLGSILCFQLFLTFFWSERIDKFYNGSLVVLYLEDVLGQNTGIFIDTQFNLPFMWYWVGLFIFIGYFQLRTKELHELGDYSSNHALRGYLLALEIFIVFYFFLYFISKNHLGNLLDVLGMRNIIAFLLFLKFFNMFTLEFFYDRIKGSKLVYWKSTALNVLLLGCISLFGYFFSDDRLNIPLLVGLACMAFLNPTIYRFTESSKTTTFLDYLLLITIFAVFRF